MIAVNVKKAKKGFVNLSATVLCILVLFVPNMSKMAFGFTLSL